MIRRVVVILGLILAIQIVVPGHTCGLKPNGQSGPIIGKPVSAIEEHYSQEIMDDGYREEHESSGLFYRDEQGRMRVESQTRIVIYDPIASVVYIADVTAKTYRKTSFQKGAPVRIAVVDQGLWVSDGENYEKSQSPSPPPASNDHSAPSTSRDLPATLINGVQARGIQTTSIIPVGAIGNDHELKVIHERWYSDENKLLLKSVDSDPRFGTTRYQLTSISQTPPAPSLFQMPSNYILVGEKK